MHSGIYKSISLELGVIIDATEVRSLILIQFHADNVDLTFIQGQWDARKQELLCQLFSKL